MSELRKLVPPPSGDSTNDSFTSLFLSRLFVLLEAPSCFFYYFLVLKLYIEYIRTIYGVETNDLEYPRRSATWIAFAASALPLIYRWRLISFGRWMSSLFSFIWSENASRRIFFDFGCTSFCCFFFYLLYKMKLSNKIHSDKFEDEVRNFSYFESLFFNLLRENERLTYKFHFEEFADEVKAFLTSGLLFLCFFFLEFTPRNWKARWRNFKGQECSRGDFRRIKCFLPTKS